MGWTVEYSERADDQLQRLDRNTSQRITDYMDRVGLLDDPRQRGRALRGSAPPEGRADWAGHWRYRVGDYRIICRIEDAVLRVLVVQVGRRDQVYC